MHAEAQQDTWEGPTTELEKLVAECVPSYNVWRRYASVFQMLRGMLVVFAGALTIILLKRRLHIHHYFGITLITAGAALVGASRCALRSNADVKPSSLNPKPTTRITAGAALAGASRCTLAPTSTF